MKLFAALSPECWVEFKFKLQVCTQRGSIYKKIPYLFGKHYSGGKSCSIYSICSCSICWNLLHEVLECSGTVLTLGLPKKSSNAVSTSLIILFTRGNNWLVQK